VYWLRSCVRLPWSCRIFALATAAIAVPSGPHGGFQFVEWGPLKVANVCCHFSCYWVVGNEAIVDIVVLVSPVFPKIHYNPSVQCEHTPSLRSWATTQSPSICIWTFDLLTYTSSVQLDTEIVIETYCSMREDSSCSQRVISHTYPIDLDLMGKPINGKPTLMGKEWDHLKNKAVLVQCTAVAKARTQNTYYCVWCCTVSANTVVVVLPYCTRVVL